jgi:hypothetical protein
MKSIRFTLLMALFLIVHNVSAAENLKAPSVSGFIEVFTVDDKGKQEPADLSTYRITFYEKDSGKSCDVITALKSNKLVLPNPRCENKDIQKIWFGSSQESAYPNIDVVTNAYNCTGKILLKSADGGKTFYVTTFDLEGCYGLR